MMQSLGAVVFEGGSDSGLLDIEMHEIRNSLTLELLKKCIQDRNIQHTVLVSDRTDLVNQAGRYPVEFFDTSRCVPFHFGKVLLEVCRRFQFQKVIVMSGASVPLMSQNELGYLSDLIVQHENTVIANNPQSADLVAFSPVAALDSVQLPEIDNPLPWILKEEGKLASILLPVSVGYNFDLDTPLDLVYLRLHPECPAEVRLHPERWQSAMVRLEAAGKVLGTPNAEILMAGRVGPWIMTYINEHVRCRLRVISEERGMKALGRTERCEVYSWLGKMIDMMGMEAFFRLLETFCDAAFIDTRVLFGHWKLHPDSNDRFYSDLGEHERIKDPLIKELTFRAAGCRIPVILGGHSIVSGGMMVLTDAVRQKTTDRPAKERIF